MVGATNFILYGTYNAPEFDKGIARFKEIDKLTNTLTVIDRYHDSLITPFPLQLYEPGRFRPAKPLPYEECCATRATELLSLSCAIEKPLLIFWSGGIDSTLVLVSFLKQTSRPDAVKVVLNNQSIAENPLFFEKYIRRNFELVSSASIPFLFNRDHIIVTGNGNDELYGTACLSKGDRSLHQKAFSFESFSALMKSVDIYDTIAIEKWYEVVQSSTNKATCEISTLRDALWWFNFIYLYQDLFFLFPMVASKFNRHNIDESYLRSYIHDFFATPLFDSWASTNPAKNNSMWKFDAKRLINEFDRNEMYYRTKKKVPSFRVITQLQKATAFDTNYQFHDSVDYFKAYNDRHFLSC